MVRLVFRPYTQVRPSICTSERLRASTRISPGFALLRHSSPSFGSQHVRSHWHKDSNALCRQCCNPRISHYRFPCASQFATKRLAHMLDSLVRVSRRVVQGRTCAQRNAGVARGAFADANHALLVSTRAAPHTPSSTLLGSPTDSPFMRHPPQPRSLPF